MWLWASSKSASFFSLLRKAIINAPLTVLLAIPLGTTGVFVAEAISQLIGGAGQLADHVFHRLPPHVPSAGPGEKVE